MRHKPTLHLREDEAEYQRAGFPLVYSTADGKLHLYSEGDDHMFDSDDPRQAHTVRTNAGPLPFRRQPQILQICSAIEGSPFAVFALIDNGDGTRSVVGLDYSHILEADDHPYFSRSAESG